jgi:hypothetical protein
LVLDEAGVVTDLYNNVPFCQVSHQDSFQMSGFLWHSRWPTSVSSGTAKARR